MKTTNALCPCTSNKPFSKCCLPYLSSTSYAKTPEKLMRSRFSAYKTGNNGAYLLSTWHTSTRPQVSEHEMNKSDMQWQHLDIINKSVDGESGLVEFKAWYLNELNELECLHERSRFVRKDKRWFYLDGKLFD